MKKNRFAVIIWFAILLGACSNAEVMNSMDTQETEKEGEKPSAYTEIMGSLQHGLQNAELDENGNKFLYYTGGELKIEYGVKGEGIQYGCGFMIYIDGIPQPYKLQEEGSEYQYMHVIETNGEDQRISFLLNPITGQKGDQLELCIASVYNCNFVPNRDEEVGMLYDMVENFYYIVYEATPETEDRSMVEATKVGEWTQEKDQKNLDEAQSSRNAYSWFYIGEENMELLRYYEISGKKKLNIEVRLTGKQGVTYKNTLYIDHVPVSETCEVSLSEGMISTISLEVDTTEFGEIHSVYVISVPCNKMEFQNDLIELLQTRPILLIKEETETDIATESESSHEAEWEEAEILPDGSRVYDSIYKYPHSSFIQYKDKDTFLLIKDKMYLYSAVTGQLLGESENTFDELTQCGFFKAANIQITSEKIMICGRRYEKEEDFGKDEEESFFSVLIYDLNMNYEGQWDLNELIWEDIGHFDILDIRISNDGKKLFLTDEKGFYRCDLETGSKEELIHYEETDILHEIIHFTPVKGSNDILFVAFCNEANEKRKLLRVCGILDTQTKEIRYLGDKNILYEEIRTGEYLTITPCDMRIEEGVAWLYDKTNDSFREYRLKDSDGIMNQWISQSGKYCIYLKRQEDQSWELIIENMLDENDSYRVTYKNAPHRVLCFDQSRVLYISDYDSEKKAEIVVKVNY